MDLQLADGVALSVRDWPVPEGIEQRGSILLVHGLGEHSGRYAHVADRLARKGLAVRGYDHRGHGGSGGARGAIPHPEAMLDDLRAVFDDLRGEGEPPFMLGHSLGGAVAARAATGGWVTPAGLVLSSPAGSASGCRGGRTPGWRSPGRWRPTRRCPTTCRST